MVASRFMLTPTLQTLLTSTSTLQVIRAHLLMMQVSSTAPMSLCSKSERSTLTPSSPRLASRLATAWSPIPSLKVLPRAAAHLPLTPTVTIVVCRLQTSCDSGCCGAGCPTCPFRPPARGVFFYVNFMLSRMCSQVYKK